MVVQRAVDPGVGRDNAEPGTVPWAQRIRLSLQCRIRELPTKSTEVIEYLKVIISDRVWTLLHKRDGERFRSFEEFLDYPYPYGLGDAGPGCHGWPWKKIRPYLSTVFADKEFALGTVAPAQPPKAGPGRGKKTDGPRDESFTPTKETRLRAILRAPEYVQKLYKADLISQKVAAKLGPRTESKDPEKRKQLDERRRQAEAIAEGVKTFLAPHDYTKVKTERERTTMRRAVDRHVLRALGQPPEDRVKRVLREVASFSVDERRRFLAALTEGQ